MKTLPLCAPLSSRRGGVLLDLFLIGAILAAGAAGWVTYKKRSWPGFLREAVSAVPSAPATLGAPAPSEPDIDVSDRSAWIQGRTRDLLATHGVGEKHVLKTYNVQRQDAGIQWLEDTLEVRRPARFDEGGFLRALGPVLAEKRLVLMDERHEGTRWTLSLGDRKRVYQRLVFEGMRPSATKR